MKQEHRLVAELYRFLAPFVDTTKDIYISPDGQAAITAAGKGRFIDAAIPDIWFTFIGASQPTLIEAKIVGADNRANLMQTQISAWKTEGTGAHKPNFWVAATIPFDSFFFWPHEQFVTCLDETKARSKTPSIGLPVGYSSFERVEELALHIIRQTT